jgi:N-acetylated-alpha-linked acidic dipeptidase
VRPYADVAISSLAVVAIRVWGVRYGECFRGVKAYQAQLREAAAVLIFSDPEEYGGPDYPSKVLPKGAYLPQSGVQRGSVLNLPRCPGNPRGRERECGYTENDLLPNIPVMPISAENALLILKSMDSDRAPGDWQGNLNVVYTFGPGSLVNLSVVNSREERTIHNIIATIPGSLPTKEDTPIVLGNHRDAWVFGAADPNSGSAAMLAVAQGLATAWQDGWRPNRTLILGSWDAEEYGIIGSTAYAERNAGMLGQAAV